MSIFSYIREQRRAYENDDIPVVEGYDFNQKVVIDRATKYWASEYDGDDSDAILGTLPFDNKIIAPVEKEVEATDFDTKDVEIRPKRNTPQSRYKSMIATKALREHMERNGFATFLNDLCFNRALYGGVLVKDTDDGTKVVPWHNLITDQSDIMSGVIVERHYYTPAELKKMDGKWENVDEALEKAQELKYADTVAHEEIETQGHFIEVYEIHGVLEASVWDDEAEDNEFEQRMIVVAGVDWVSEDDKGNREEEGVILFNQTETKSPYKYNARNAIPGRALGVGVAESLFNTQKFHNFTLAEELRMMSIAGKIFFDSDNPNTPNNLLTKLDHGMVLKRSAEHSPVTQVNAVPSSLPAYENIRAEFDNSAREITGAHESVTGEENKSGTPFRLAALQNIEGHSRYEQEREEIGEFVEEIIRDWELPRAIKWITKEDELYTHFEPQELMEIDEILIAKRMNRKIVDMTLAGEAVSPEFVQAETAKLQKELRRGGTKRLVKAIKEQMKDIEGDVRVSTTAEHLNKQAWFESRANIIKLLDPADPRRSALINRIMEEAGITEEEIRVEQEKLMATQQAQVEFNNQEREAPAQQVA